MASLKDLEDSLKSFLIQEQSDAHNIRTANIAKYNNLKIWMNPSKYHQAHFFVRISISEAVFSLNDCVKINGGLGYEERFIYKWFGRIGIKSKLEKIWAEASQNIEVTEHNKNSEKEEDKNA